MTDLPTIKAVYTDGACSGNPGPGGWGTVIYFVDGQVHEMGGHASGTTNNRMEMQAAIAALQFLQHNDYDSPIELNTDSKYLIQGITQWMSGWKRKGWKTSAGKAVLNQDLWMTLDKLKQDLATSQGIDIDWRYVKGHAGNVGNERCDEIARAYSHKQSIRLKQLTAKVLASKQLSSTRTADNGPKSEEADCDRIAAEAPDRQNQMNTEAGDTLQRLSHILNRLQMADTLAEHGYLITTQELADLVNETVSDIAKRGAQWTWRNWSVVQVGGNGADKDFWQLERLDSLY
ncbi:ribonuclease HI [Leptolyngbyaceae cyanobacterium CCMR0082]|uniref:Ribonuclease H n=1 Tax=Adonisia turfae CCMR0082 TaxID=2304604 RepID=A0A6M0SBQ2_9CYAN|nr:ribonuclease HI [Adonisia turfae]NEZ65411.1 ribonuclease HI [Adonisia turfae CCMR0082]